MAYAGSTYTANCAFTDDVYHLVPVDVRDVTYQLETPGGTVLLRGTDDQLVNIGMGRRAWTYMLNLATGPYVQHWSATRVSDGQTVEVFAELNVVDIGQVAGGWMTLEQARVAARQTKISLEQVLLATEWVESQIPYRREELPALIDLADGRPNLSGRFDVALIQEAVSQRALAYFNAGIGSSVEEDDDSVAATSGKSKFAELRAERVKRISQPGPSSVEFFDDDPTPSEDKDAATTKALRAIRKLKRFHDAPQPNSLVRFGLDMSQATSTAKLIELTWQKKLRGW